MFSFQIMLVKLIAYLASLEAQLVIHGDFKIRARLSNLHNRRAAQVAIGVVTVSKSQAVNIAMALIIRCPVVQKSANASALGDS